MSRLNVKGQIAGQFIHHIAPDVDTERDALMRDLAAADPLDALAYFRKIFP